MTFVPETENRGITGKFGMQVTIFNEILVEYSQLMQVAKTLDLTLILKSP
jgi:hypothetical protein